MLLAATPCVAAVSPFGAQRPVQRGVAIAAVRADGTSEIHSSSMDGSRVRVIVEFTSPPRARTPVSLRPAAQAAPPFERFRDDLKRIQETLTASGDTSGNAVEVRQEYSLAFSGLALSVTPSQRAAIEKLPYVLRVHPDLPVTAAAVEPGVATIQADEVWRRLGSRGAGITVAILDTGVDYRHPALGEGFGPGFKVKAGYDFVNKDADPMDDSGHGTHVAGIVAANAPDLSGVAPDASLVAYKVLNAGGSGWTSDILAGIERTVDPNGDGDLSDHAAVANMSLGGPGYSDDAMSRAVDSAVSAGVVFVVAAGNLGNFQSVSSPGTAEAAITVGATNFQDALAPFTSKGPPAARYGIKPDVVAPGVDVRSAKAGGGTLAASGTSMAAPHVAGAAALLRALHPDWTPAEVKAALVTTAAPVAGEVMAAGAGRIDAFRAATLATRILPEHLAFGIIDGKAPAWSGTRKIAVTNRGAAPQTYDLVTTGARDGIRVDVSPATVSLQPGESVEVAVSVSVENAKVAYPADGSLSYSGFVEVRSANDVLRVPWAFVKAARMRVRYTDDQAEARVFLGGWTATTRFLPSIGRNLFEMLVQPGSYSLILITFAEVDPARETTMIVRDDQHIDGEREFDLSPADAPYRLTFTASDEGGWWLRREGSQVECLPFRYLLFHTQSFGYRGIDLLYSTGTWRLVASYPPDIRTSSITDRYSFFSGETCLDATLSKFYVFDYAPIRGVSADVSRQAGGAELRAQETRISFPPTSDGWRLLNLASRFIDGPSPGGLAPGFLLDGWPSPEWNGTVFLARSADPDVALRPVFLAQTDLAWFNTHPLQVIDRGVASFSTWTPSPTTFVASPVDPLDFGLGPVMPKLAITGFANGAEVQAHLTGPLDERVVSSNPAVFRLFDRNGRLQREEETDRWTIEDLSRPVRLEIEANRTHDLQTHEGRALVSAWFGGGQPDQLPPSLTTLVVLDARSQPANRLGRGLPARLRFSAIDVAGGAAAPGRVKLEATRVWARPTGTGEWRPVPVAVHGEDLEDPSVSGRDPAGTIFECALAEITKEEGVFDLRIRVEDTSANTTEMTLVAAFAVAEAPSPRRSRVVRH
ncbi:MAG TPA: S8 family serine peptidase [Thermoanaerobaculia bacterium]